MTWSDIRGHEAVEGRFRQAATQNRLGSSFLFVGPPGVGKRTFALQLAQALLCESGLDGELDACSICPACQQVAAGSHPDLEIIEKPADRSFIPIELFIGDREHRMREGLCHNISLKPFRGGRKIAIIDDADALNVDGANCLLKTLEEPPPNSVLILIATNEQRQLPTIRSRCQVVRFSGLSTETVADLLLKHEHASSRDEAMRWAAASGGSPLLALSFADQQLADFRLQLFRQLGDPQFQSVGLAAEITRFVETAGKDAPVRRNQLRYVIRHASEFYASLIRHLSDPAWSAEGDADQSAQIAAQKWPTDAEAAADCLERCLVAQIQLESNANLATLTECWIDDVARTVLGVR